MIEDVFSLRFAELYKSDILMRFSKLSNLFFSALLCWPSELFVYPLMDSSAIEALSLA